MNDAISERTDRMQSVILLVARRLAEFLVLTTVCIVIFFRGPFWQWPPFFRLITALTVSAAVFLIYVALIRWLAQRRIAASGVANAGSIDATTASVDDLASRTFRVPQNFGMQTVVLATLAFAILTAMLQSLQIPPLLSLSIIGFVSLISAMQIFLNRVPRMASSIAGLVVGTLLGVAYHGSLSLWLPRGSQQGLWLALFFGVVLGTVMGYAGGALVAGVFLLSDSVMEWWKEGTREKV